jgi:hypothetical protein
MINWKIFREALLFSTLIWFFSFFTFALAAFCDGNRCDKTWPVFLISGIIVSILVCSICYFFYGRSIIKSLKIFLFNTFSFVSMYLFIALPISSYKKPHPYCLTTNIYIYIYIYICSYLIIYSIVSCHTNKSHS